MRVEEESRRDAVDIGLLLDFRRRRRACSNVYASVEQNMADPVSDGRNFREGLHVGIQEIQG